MAEKVNYKKTTITGFAWQFMERIGVQLITMVVSVILARLLGPEAYGEIALTTIFIAVCDVFVVSGFGTALVQKKYADDLDYCSVFYSGLVISIVLYMALFFSAPYIADAFNVPIFSPVLRVVGLRLPISALGTVQNAYVSKHFMFKHASICTIISNIVSGIVGVTLAFCGFGVWSLVIKELTYIIFSKIVLFFVTKWYPKLKYSWQRTKQLFSYSWKLLGANLLNTAYLESTSVIIGAKYSTTELAYFNKGKSWPAMIYSSVGSPIRTVLFSVFSDANNSRGYIKNMVRRSIKLSSYIMMPLFFGLAAIAPVFTLVLLGEQWASSIIFMQILCFEYVLYPLDAINVQVLQATGRSDYCLITEIIKRSIGVVIILITLWFGPVWMAAGYILTAIISVFVHITANKKVLNYGVFQQLGEIIPFMLMALCMALPVYAMNYLTLSLGINKYLVLVLQILVGIVIYVAISKLFKVESYKYLINTIKEFKNRKNKLKKKATTEKPAVTEKVSVIEQVRIKDVPILENQTEKNVPILWANSTTQTILQTQTNKNKPLLLMAKK